MVKHHMFTGEAMSRLADQDKSLSLKNVLLGE
jgi:hypothetical protein